MGYPLPNSFVGRSLQFEDGLISVSRCARKMALTRHRHVETSDTSGLALRPPITGDVAKRVNAARFSISISFLDLKTAERHRHDTIAPPP